MSAETVARWVHEVFPHLEDFKSDYLPSPEWYDGVGLNGYLVARAWKDLMRGEWKALKAGHAGGRE